jgi:aryl-alcohol dehydrogenase-like predicted oxidoreductase
MTWGEQNTQNDGFEQMDYALDQGVNFWDTAEIYSIPPKQQTFGDTETIIGNWFEKTKKRKEVILASKVCGPMREYVRGGGNQFGTKNITEALNGSLKRLKTDYIDLYQLHWPERKTNFFGKLGYEHDDSNEWTKFEDILADLNNFKDQGKIRHIGLSNETPWGLSKFLEISKNKNLPRMLSVQNPYNLLNRTYEVGLAEMSVREKAGKYRNNQMPKGTRIERDGEFWTRYNTPNSDKAIDAYFKIAEKHKLNLAQMSLKFLEIQPFVTSVIIGATTMDQLKTNIESVNIKLTNEVIKEINEVQKTYPNPCP